MRSERSLLLLILCSGARAADNCTINSLSRKDDPSGCSCIQPRRSATNTIPIELIVYNRLLQCGCGVGFGVVKSWKTGLVCHECVNGHYGVSQSISEQQYYHACVNCVAAQPSPPEGHRWTCQSVFPRNSTSDCHCVPVPQDAVCVENELTQAWKPAMACKCKQLGMRHSCGSLPCEPPPKEFKPLGIVLSSGKWQCGCRVGMAAFDTDNTTGWKDGCTTPANGHYVDHVSVTATAYEDVSKTGGTDCVAAQPSLPNGSKWECTSELPRNSSRDCVCNAVTQPSPPPSPPQPPSSPPPSSPPPSPSPTSPPSPAPTPRPPLLTPLGIASSVGFVALLSVWVGAWCRIRRRRAALAPLHLQFLDDEVEVEPQIEPQVEPLAQPHVASGE